MKNIINIIKRHKILFALIFFVISMSILLAGLGGEKPAPSPTPVGKIATLDDVKPGESGEDDVENKLGRPISTQTLGEQKLAEYRTSNRYINHEAVFENGVVVLIKERMTLQETRNTETIRQQFGLAPNVLYEQSPESFFNLYIYPDNGIAFLGHEDGTLLEIWYFVPTTIEDFTNKWAKGYASTQFDGPHY